MMTTWTCDALRKRAPQRLFPGENSKGVVCMARTKDVVRLVRDGMKDTTSASRLAEIVKVLRRNGISKGLTPEKLVSMIEDLGPTFIKLGQILSARSDMLPQEYCDALQTLRSATTPEPFEHVERRLSNLYDGDYRTVFAHVDEHPLGSASIAQVHRACLLERAAEELAEDVPHQGECASCEVRETCEVGRRAKGHARAEAESVRFEALEEAAELAEEAAEHAEAIESADADGDSPEYGSVSDAADACAAEAATQPDCAAVLEDGASAPVESLGTGMCICVKIRRDHVRQDMQRDIQLMRRAADLLNLTGSAMLSGVDVYTVIDEFDRTVREEIDFNVERTNLQRFARNRAREKGVSCPAVYPELSDDAVLVMEFVEGISLERVDDLKAAGYNLRDIGDRIASSYMRQMVEDGFFHADPHAANLIVRPALSQEERDEGKRDPGEVVWIDCGMMGELSPHERTLFADMMKAMVSKDGYALTNLFIEWGRVSDAPGKRLNYGQLLQDLTTLVNRYSAEDVHSMDIAQMLNDIMAILDTANVIMPRSFVMLVRGLANLQGTLIALTPEISILDVVARYMKRQMKKDFDPFKTVERHTAAAVSAAEKTVQIPERVVNVLDMVEKGRMKIGLDLAEANQPMEKLGKIVDRLSLAIITAGLFVGSSTIAGTGMQPQVFGVPIIGFLGYLGAAVLSVYIVLKIRKGV